MLRADELPPVAAPLISETPTPSEKATSGIESAVQMAQEEVRDPFAKAPESGASANAVDAEAQAGAPPVIPELQGIGFGSKDAYAVLGGEVFYLGDEKQGIKLLEVRRREVDILMSGGLITVPLFPDQELRKAKDRAEKKRAVEKALQSQSSGTNASLSERKQPPL